MLRSVLLASALACACATSAAAAPAASATATPARNASAQALFRLFDAQWERGLRESPEGASYNGDKRFNDRWTDQSLSAIQARAEGDRKALAELKAIDRGQLSVDDQLNYDVFAWNLEKAIERQKYREYLMPLSQQGGVQTLD
ncbi:DUF885 family protein, partial [Lysobacter sp. 2RAB21]